MKIIKYGNTVYKPDGKKTKKESYIKISKQSFDLETEEGWNFLLGYDPLNDAEYLLKQKEDLTVQIIKWLERRGLPCDMKGRYPIAEGHESTNSLIEHLSLLERKNEMAGLYSAAEALAFLRKISDEPADKDLARNYRLLFIAQHYRSHLIIADMEDKFMAGNARTGEAKKANIKKAEEAKKLVKEIYTEIKQKRGVTFSKSSASKIIETRLLKKHRITRSQATIRDDLKNL